MSTTCVKCLQRIVSILEHTYLLLSRIPLLLLQTLPSNPLMLSCLCVCMCVYVHTCADLLQLATATVCSWLHWPCHTQKQGFTGCLLSCSSYCFINPFPKMSPGLGGVVIDAPFRSEQSTATCSQHFDQLVVSFYINCHSLQKRNFFDQKGWQHQLKGVKNDCLEGSVATYKTLLLQLPHAWNAPWVPAIPLTSRKDFAWRSCWRFGTS